jgi:hemoglobin
MPQPTLFDAIGGDPAIAAAVEAFYRRVLADPALAPFFADTNVDRLQAHQRAFLTLALRGSGTYNGRTMRAAHADRGITDADFDRVAMHLGATLAALDVPAELIEQIIGGIAPLRPDIVDATAGRLAA